MTVVNNALRGNDGLNSTNAVYGISGTVSGGGLVTVPTPEFMVPRTARDNILLDSQAALYSIDPGDESGRGGGRAGRDRGAGIRAPPPA